jgi:hypothetical protein
MTRTLTAVLVAASLTAAVAADPTDADDKAAAKAAQTKQEDRGWFSRVNPFSPLGNPGAATTEPDPPPDGTVPDAVAGAATGSEASPAPKDEAQSTVPVLNGILFCDHLVIAIISDAIAKTGDLLNGYRITSITHDTVLAEKDGRQHIMTTRRPQAQLDVPRGTVPGKATKPAAPDNRGKTPSSASPKTADTTGAGPHAPAMGVSESVQAAPDGAR